MRQPIRWRCSECTVDGIMYLTDDSRSVRDWMESLAPLIATEHTRQSFECDARYLDVSLPVVLPPSGT